MLSINPEQQRQQQPRAACCRNNHAAAAGRDPAIGRVDVDRSFLVGFGCDDGIIGSLSVVISR